MIYTDLCHNDTELITKNEKKGFLTKKYICSKPAQIIFLNKQNN